ncbi:MAG TPA: glycosyltransferase [Chitinophagaceae bacterium]|nr:glycosyltransferase [Chitinophagaceae bacterium]
MSKTILFIADNIGAGGKERRMSELLKSLCKYPFYQIILVSLTRMEFVYEYIYKLPITLIEIDRKSRFSLKPFFTIKNAIKKYKPDIVHSWSSMGSMFMLPLLFSRKFRFINGIIADAPLKVPWYQKNYLRGLITFPFSDLVISNSQAGIKSYRAPAAKTVCIYNGIDPDRFTNLPDPQIIRKQTGLEKFKYIIGMVGAFYERKDHNTFINAAKIIVREHKDFGFLLIGDGETRSRIEQQLSREEKRNIIFLGRRSDVEALVQIFDIGVLCTNLRVHGEGISNSIIEYMALSKPVIATEGGGTKEIITDNENGYLIGDRDVSSLVEKILFLYHNPCIANSIGQAAQKTIQNKFLLERMTAEYISVYEQK